MALSQSNLSLPVWQSRALLVAALAALAAAALGSGVYAFQTASASQEVWGIPSDALLKTVLSCSAELGVAFGAVVTAWLWRTGRRGLRKQAYLAGAMTAVAVLVAAGNLAGYTAWTRAVRVAEVARSSDEYRIAARRRDANQYLSGADEAILRRARAPADAEREAGDWGRAFAVHICILGFGAAFRLPAAAKRKRKAKPVRKQVVKVPLRAVL